MKSFIVNNLIHILVNNSICSTLHSVLHFVHSIFQTISVTLFESTRFHTSLYLFIPIFDLFSFHTLPVIVHVHQFPFQPTTESLLHCALFPFYSTSFCSVSIPCYPTHFHSTPGGGWDLNNYKTFPISQSTIKDMCMVGKRLWIAVGSQCHIFNMKSHKAEVRDHEHEYLTQSVCDAPVWLIFR